VVRWPITSSRIGCLLDALSTLTGALIRASDQRQ
jgi:hypothetical protein